MLFGLLYILCVVFFGFGFFFIFRGNLIINLYIFQYDYNCVLYKRVVMNNRFDKNNCQNRNENFGR